MTLVPIGKYRARAGEVQFGESKLRRTPFVWIDFRITQGPEAGQSVEWTGFFSEKTEERTIQSMRYCGCALRDGDVFDTEGFDGNEVQIVVEHEQYENAKGEQATRAKVAWVNSGVGGVREEQKMSADGQAAFRARMRGAVLASKPAGGAPAASSGDADIPF